MEPGLGNDPAKTNIKIFKKIKQKIIGEHNVTSEDMMEPETHKKKNRKYIMGFMDGNIFVMLDALELWIRGI